MSNRDLKGFLKTLNLCDSDDASNKLNSYGLENIINALKVSLDVSLIFH